MVLRTAREVSPWQRNALPCFSQKSNGIAWTRAERFFSVEVDLLVSEAKRLAGDSNVENTKPRLIKVIAGFHSRNLPIRKFRSGTKTKPNMFATKMRSIQ